MNTYGGNPKIIFQNGTLTGWVKTGVRPLPGGAMVSYRPKWRAREAELKERNEKSSHFPRSEVKICDLRKWKY